MRALPRVSRVIGAALVMLLYVRSSLRMPCHFFGERYVPRCSINIIQLVKKLFLFAFKPLELGAAIISEATWL